MKHILWFTVLLLWGCNNNPKNNTPEEQAVPTPTETTVVEKPVKPVTLLPKQYENQRFKEVSVDMISDTQFRIFGKAQIFEATFNWVVEDGHEELSKGYEMTDAGAPEWGKFDFTIDIKKKRENSTLHLILFETSAMDGSRQHELPIPLY